MSEEAPTIDEIARRMLRKGDVAGFVIDWMRAPITKEKLVAGMRRTIETAAVEERRLNSLHNSIVGHPHGYSEGVYRVLIDEARRVRALKQGLAEIEAMECETIAPVTLACQRLASTAMTDGDAMGRAAAYEDAWRIVREETGR